MPKDATGLPRGDSRSLLQKPELLAQRCHGLAPWRFTLAATQARGIFGPNNGVFGTQQLGLV